MGGESGRRRTVSVEEREGRGEWGKERVVWKQESVTSQQKVRFLIALENQEKPQTSKRTESYHHEHMLFLDHPDH